jgi:hypothetical protein
MAGPFFPKAKAGMLSGLLGGEDHLKWCSLCAEQDETKYGTAYWHRAHQLHQVVVCHRHSVPLIRASSSTTLKDRHKLFLPKASSSHYSSLFLADETQIRQWRFAKLSVDLLHVNRENLDQVDIRQAYLSKARAMGFTSSNRSIDYLTLSAALDKHHAGYEFLESPAIFQADKPVERHWVMSLLRSKRSLVHPVAHVLLIDFLFDGLRGLLEMPLSSMQNTEKTETGIDWKALLHKYCIEQSMSMTEVAALTRTSVTTMTVLARAHGIPVRSRRKRIKVDVEDHILDALRNGQTISQVAKAQKLAPVSIYRVLRAHPQVQSQLAAKRTASERDVRRVRFLEAVAKSDKPVKRVAPADYAWLWRNDKAWLSGTLSSRSRVSPPRTVVDWAERDVELARHASLVVDEIYRSLGKPIRITKNEIFRRLPSLRVMDKKLAKLPKTASVLDSRVESSSEFHVRSLTWAITEMSERGHTLSPSGIVRYASIRETAIPIAEVLLADLSTMSLKVG